MICLKIKVTAEILDLFFIFSFKKSNGNSRGLIRQIICIAGDVKDKTNYETLLRLAHYFVFSLFFLSSIEIHSVLVTGTVATRCVYLKNLYNGDEKYLKC